MCRIKRPYFRSRQEANNELLEMSGGSATSSSSEYGIEPTKRLRQANNQTNFEKSFKNKRLISLSQPFIQEECISVTPAPLNEQNFIPNTTAVSLNLITSQDILDAEFINIGQVSFHSNYI